MSSRALLVQGLALAASSTISAGSQNAIRQNGHILEAIEAETREAVFNYFAGTLFDKQPPDARQILLRTAFVRQITPALAEQLTGSPNAGKLLEHLHRLRNL
jgi:ATP/maltotriose-dependent transcriptional regulator MalT